MTKMQGGCKETKGTIIQDTNEETGMDYRIKKEQSH